VLIVWLLIRRPWELWDITSGVSKDELGKAKSSASSSNAPILPKLKSTESNYRWTLLYNHARVVQIDPSKIRRMRRSDLEYLAGMDFPHPDLTEPARKGEFQDEVGKRHEQITKLQGNVSRAKAELARRNLWGTTAITAVAVLVAALLGALLASNK
jgi:hypothetical protein